MGHRTFNAHDLLKAPPPINRLLGYRVGDGGSEGVAFPDQEPAFPVAPLSVFLQVHAKPLDFRVLVLILLRVPAAAKQPGRLV